MASTHQQSTPISLLESIRTEASSAIRAWREWLAVLSQETGDGHDEQAWQSPSASRLRDPFRKC